MENNTNISDKIEIVLSEIKQKLIPHIKMNIKDVNCGGCGIMAYYLTKRLKDLYIPFEIREIDQITPKDTFTVAKNPSKEVSNLEAFHSATNYFQDILDKKLLNIRDPDLRDFGWTHIMVLIKNHNKNYIIDGENVIKIDSDKPGTVLAEPTPLMAMMGEFDGAYLGEPIKFELLEQIVTNNTNPDMWNKKFKTEQIPKIQKIVETDLV